MSRPARRASAVLIVNPAASGVTPRSLDRVARALSAAGQLEVLRTERPGHATELAAAASSERELIYVFAGDGGFNEVVNGISGTVPVGFLPGGRTSVLPRALGLPRDPVVCARRIAASSRLRTISLGRATLSSSVDPGEKPTSRRFTFAAGVGLDAEIVRAVDRRGRRGGKRPGDIAFLAEIARALARRRGRLEPMLTVEGYGRCALAVVANCDPYTYAGPLAVHAAPRARFELGLDLVAPTRLGRLGVARLTWRVLARPVHPRSREILYLHDQDRLELRCDQPAPVELDGEDVGDATKVVFEAERDALRVLV